jgi:hypothetical protein
VRKLGEEYLDDRDTISKTLLLGYVGLGILLTLTDIPKHHLLFPISFFLQGSKLHEIFVIMRGRMVLV